MPYISIECGPLTAAQKQLLIEKVTFAAAEATSIPQQFFMVSVKELPDSSFAIGDRTIDRIKAEFSERKEASVYPRAPKPSQQVSSTPLAGP